VWLLEKLLYVFLLPGSLAIKAVGITLEEDGGIFRSMINMLFWGTVSMPFVLALSTKRKATTTQTPHRVTRSSHGSASPRRKPP